MLSKWNGNKDYITGAARRVFGRRARTRMVAGRVIRGIEIFHSGC